MSMMVSFLMVTRSNIAYSRYMEARQELTNATLACREVVSYGVTFTRYDQSENAQHWRLSLARTTIKVLRAMVAVLEYGSTKNHAWKTEIFSIDEKKLMTDCMKKSNERVPVLLSLFLRTNIASNREYLEEQLHPNKELKLYALVSDFTHAYHSLMKLVTTPFPFPLVQMTRTFLFVWIFTLPWVLVRDLDKISALLLTVFFITYAFVGLEYVAIELDDPFGDDPNDFDVLEIASVTFQDIYIFIYDLHGENRSSKDLGEFIQHAKKRYCVNDESAAVENEAQTEEARKWCCFKSRSSVTTSTNLTRASGHNRAPSLVAWNMSIPSLWRKEAGFETSKLLLREEARRQDEMERHVNNVPDIDTGLETSSLLPSINEGYDATSMNGLGLENGERQCYL